jgi:hypothetical protein
MKEKRSDIAFIIGNAGLGDSISLIGMANYLTTIYKLVFFTTSRSFRDTVKLFFTNPKIIVYDYDEKKTNIFEFDLIMRKFSEVYDLYILGHFGNLTLDRSSKYTKVTLSGETKKIIHDYPKSYYEDVNIPPEYAITYFSVTYDDDILKRYDELLSQYSKYRVVHQVGSTAKFDVIKKFDIDINDMLTIDVNRNLYPSEHKYHDICEKFINLPKITNYAKLLENASELYLMDSCIHALALLVNINKAYPRVCLKRTYNFNYGIPNKFVYYLICIVKTVNHESI